MTRPVSATGFQSILFQRPGPGSGGGGPEPAEPDFFADLNLGQFLESMLARHGQYQLKPFFYAPLHRVDDVQYRHEVFRDLEQADVLKSVSTFAERMRSMREHLAQAGKLHYQLQKQSWFLDAVGIYCEAVRGLAQELAERDVTSRGFRRLRGFLAAYTASELFTSLACQTRALKDALAGVRYAIRIHGPRVTVSRYQGEPDYGAQVEQTFAKFRRGAVKSYLLSLHELADMDHVEAQIVSLVAKLFPEVFGTLGDYCTGHSDYLDPVVGRFDREVQFYLAYLDLAGQLREAGLPLCYPRVCASSNQTAASVCTGLFTHYKREEDAAMESGKLDEELSRMSAIADQITRHSMLLCNESFASTNEREGSEIARQVIRAMLDKQIKVVFVTHMYDLAHGFFEQHPGHALFLRAEREPDGRRTFKLIEGKPLPTSYGEDSYRRIFGPGGNLATEPLPATG
jgi:hypothetical protein